MSNRTCRCGSDPFVIVTEIPRVEFPRDPSAEEKTDKILKDVGAFAILNPGAGWGAKQ